LEACTYHAGFFMSIYSKNLYAVIVAGGSGSRMKSVIAKQFLPLDDKPILAHTVERFLRIPNCKVIAVLPARDMIFWQEIVDSSEKLIVAEEDDRLITVEGGSTRYQSVKNGLSVIEDEEGLVAIHDGVRPLIKTDLITESYKQAFEHGSAVLSVPMKDSARVVDENGNRHIDRKNICLIQTPQTFDLKKIKDAFALGEKEFFTDDASVYEFAGNTVNLIQGDYRNIKITTPEDLDVAELFLKDNS
jgi:2-C-methyl-D-erythritol 4-phosphate cytidylyltransferase